MLYNPMTNRRIEPDVVELYIHAARREQSRAFARAIERVFRRR